MLVLAYRSEHPFTFCKPWGIQDMPAGSWLIVPLNSGAPSGDIYGCHPDAFAETYRELPSVGPNAFEKHAVVQAWQPGIPFSVVTEIAGRVEAAVIGTITDWVLMNPGTELYVVSEVVFNASYRLIDE